MLAANRVGGLTGFSTDEVHLSHHVAYGSRTTRFGKYQCNRSLHRLHLVPFMVGQQTTRILPSTLSKPPNRIGNNLPFSPSLVYESSESFPSARYYQLLWPLLTSVCLVKRNQIQLSPGKGLFLLPIPAASTTRDLLVKDVVKMCSLIHLIQPQYAVSVRQYRSLQSRFLHCLDHSKPACNLLTGFTNSPVRDLHPLEYWYLSIPCAHAGRTQNV